MITILVCDDKKEFAHLLNIKLRDIIAKGKYCDLQYNIIVMENPTQAMDFCTNNTVDISFLDIDMPDINGFDLATTLNATQTNIKLIFVSNFDHFVYTSLKFKPFRFIRKTKIDTELKEALDSALNEIFINTGFLILSNKYSNERILYSNILYIESKGNYAEINTVDGNRYLHRTTLSKLCETLDNFDFVRIHAGFAVSLSKIKYINSDTVELKNGITLKVSRKYNGELKERFYKYLRR